jgi:hypothetical protein
LYARSAFGDIEKVSIGVKTSTHPRHIPLFGVIPCTRLEITPITPPVTQTLPTRPAWLTLASWVRSAVAGKSVEFALLNTFFIVFSFTTN